MNPAFDQPPRIFLADDHQAILDRASALLDAKFQLVGRAQNGRAALEGIGSLHPDVLVMDIGMPVLDGIQVMQQLHEKGSPIKVVFLTVQEDPDYVNAAFLLGARAYVAKPRMGSDLVRAVEEVIAGRTFVSPTLPVPDQELAVNIPDSV